VADTSRPTRSADQPSGCIHDRPAVNGRAHSPSRLKPADPTGAGTQPIDSGVWAPHSPLQGACGFSPGLQPRAHSGRDRHPHTGDGGYSRPCRTGGSGGAWPLQDGRYGPTVAGIGCTGDVPTHRCRGEALPRPPRHRRGRLPWRASTTCTMSPVPGRPPHHGIPGPAGLAGQAPP